MNEPLLRHRYRALLSRAPQRLILPAEVQRAERSRYTARVWFWLLLSLPVWLLWLALCWVASAYIYPGL